MSEENYIPLRKYLNESLIRNLITFLLLFLLILTQEWSNILLLLFPLISFSFSLFFEMVASNKWRVQPNNSPITYNPLGSERKHSNRLYFISIIQLILLFWLGAESLYRPQMIQFYSLFFNLILLFTYSFGFYWIFIDLWKYSKLSVLLDQNDMAGNSSDFKSINKRYKEIFSKLKIKNFKRISIGSLFVFLFLNLGYLVFILFQFLGMNLGFLYFLPGTGIESSEAISISYFTLVVMVISPLAAIIFLRMSYKDINELKTETIQKTLASLPENIQIIIRKNLKLLHKKFNRDLNVD